MIKNAKNAREVLANVEEYIDLIEINRGKKLKLRAIYSDLSIFDWWNDTLCMTQLILMANFLNEAIKLGFDKYVCFKVGASGCSHGMWACTDEGITDERGYTHSPDTGKVLFHSFRNGDNYYAYSLDGGKTYYPNLNEEYGIRTDKELETELARRFVKGDMA